MRDLRVILPLVVFLLSASISAGLAVAFRNNIHRVVNAAERNGYPIVVASSMRSDFKLAVYTLDEPGALLVTNSVKNGIYDCYFDDSGTLHYSVWDPLVDQTVEFPNYRPIGEYRSELAASISSGNPTLSYRTNNGQVRYSNNGSMLMMEDRLNFSAISIPVIRLDDRYTSPLSKQSYYTSERDIFLAGNSIYLLADKVIYSQRSSAYIYRTELLRFDMDTRQWSRPYAEGDGQLIQYVYYGQNAALIAFTIQTQTHEVETVILDGETGRRIEVLDGVSDAVIGRRWVAGSGYNDNDRRVIYLYDMYNDWERYEIELPYYGHYSYYSINWAIALYEPESTLRPDN